MKTKVQKLAIRLFQLFILLVMRLYYVGRVQIHVEGKLDIKNPIVIAANHAHRHDPFIIACFLPLRAIFKVFPYGFMTANVYYYRLWKPVAFLAGCFPAKARHESLKAEDYGVGAAVKYLRGGYSVVMFPEGRRTDTPVRPKPGVSHILKHHDSTLLLCHISWRKSVFGRVATLNLRVADQQVDTQNPEAIMRAVYSLKRKIEPEPAAV